jgi:hypothetical protein
MATTAALPDADLSRKRHDQHGARTARAAAERSRLLESYE